MKDSYSFMRQKNKMLDHSLRIPLLFILSALLLIVVVSLFWNTSTLDSVLRSNTETYATEVTNQLSINISQRLELYSSYIDQMASSLSYMPETEVNKSYLDEKAAAMDFDSIIILEKDGTIIPESFYCEYFEEWKQRDVDYYGSSQISYIDGHKTLFSSPIVKNGTAEQLLIGIRENTSMQQFLTSASFGGKGLSCIVDAEGNLIVSPTDVKPFVQIGDLISPDSQSSDELSAEQLLSDINSNHSGILSFTSADGTPLILAYHFLEVNNWILLTLIPQNLISKGSSAYILRSFIIIGGIAFVFFLILIYIVSSQKSTQIRLEKVAFTDPLTGGINLPAFQMKCRNLISSQPPKTYSMVFINVRDFKHINENFGIEAGNNTLKYIHSVYKRHLNEDEAITRSEMDHFLLCLHENDQEAICRRLEEISADINAFPNHENRHYTISLRSSVFVIDNPELDIQLMQGRAILASQYQTGAGTCTFYDEKLINKINLEAELNSLFAESLQNHDFQVYLQPKVQLSDQTLHGAEALVRWYHPKRGTIYPSDFIPLFESNGNIRQLDLYMFEEVCKLLCQWRDERKPLIPISVNLSRVHIQNPNFLAAFIELKDKYQIPDGFIELEMTESIIFDTSQIKLMNSIMRKIHQHGLSCSMDDFGFGYSSLALLKDIDVDTIKLDRQFFLDGLDGKSGKIISSFISLAHQLDISVVAEGIETQEHVSALREMGCDMVQGYVYSRPLPVEDFERWAKTLKPLA